MLPELEEYQIKCFSRAPVCRFAGSALFWCKGTSLREATSVAAVKLQFNFLLREPAVAAEQWALFEVYGGAGGPLLLFYHLFSIYVCINCGL